MTDVQVGTVKLVTSRRGTIEFLENLENLYRFFSIHEKGKMVQYIDSISASLTCNLVAKYFTCCAREEEDVQWLSETR